MTSQSNYLSGLGNHHQSEAISGVLPEGQNSPQHPEKGLYPEQISGSSFVSPRHENLRTWFYRIRPSVMHPPFEPIDVPGFLSAPSPQAAPNPNQLRWNPIAEATSSTSFMSGVQTWALNGCASARKGLAVHLYAFNQAMKHQYLMNSDGEFLFVPQIGGIEILTEMGRLEVSPSEVAVVPRGVKFQVNPLSKSCRGYIAENYGSPLRLPYLGPIGANGLAQPRDFQAPKAQFHEEEGVFELLCKFDGTFWKTKLNHNPLDVVAWHGNYYPYRYDLKKFNTINTVSFDHPDPSIFTVLTSPSEIPGTANLDFVIFPPRWMVAEKTFRPPYYHRNIMSEFMGLIHGVYDAKETGFVPGGSSLHNCMASHGPDTEALIKGTDADLKPQYLGDTLAFMFESVLAFYPTKRALDSASLQKDYYRCWQGIPKRFHSS